MLKQTEAIEEKAMKLHQTELKGFTPQQAETHFLRLASQLDTYAVDPHPVKVSLKWIIWNRRKNFIDFTHEHKILCIYHGWFQNFNLTYKRVNNTYMCQ